MRKSYTNCTKARSLTPARCCVCMEDLADCDCADLMDGNDDVCPDCEEIGNSCVC